MAKGLTQAIQKKRIVKLRRKKKLIHKVIDYLKSDCYLFAPLISSSALPSDSREPRKRIEIEEPTKDKRSLVKKIEEYLKSDCYMYASLIAPQSLSVSPRGSVGYVKKVTMEVSRRTSIMKGDKVISETAANLGTEKRSDEQKKMHKEPVKRMIYRNCRSSSISGEEMVDQRIRKIVVD